MNRIKKELIYSPRRAALTKFLKNKLAVFGIVVMLLLVISSFTVSFFSPWGRDDIDLYSIEKAPGKEHILGTDELGRDIFTRLLHGARVSMAVGVLASIFQIFIGMLLGALAGYLGGGIDSIIMRITDIIMCFPFYIVTITLAAIVGPSMGNMIVIMSLLGWPQMARIVRAQVLSLKERDFIQASRSLGLNSMDLIFKHILPNTLPSILVFGTLAIADGILTEAALSFLGLGVTPPQPSWGNILAAAQSMRVMQYCWWMWIPAGSLVLLTVLSINFIGDGLRDALDPEMKI